MTPRFVVAGTHSGVGKTTIATGLMAAFRARGLDVASAKVGPDFVDPGYHALATGRPPRNLDAWLCGPDAIAPLAARAAHGADLMVIEGVMGLFDGAVDKTPSSTADIARLIEAPVVLVVDGSAMSSSVAALVRGYRDHDPRLTLAGVILNHVSGKHHRALLTEALEEIDIAVLGCIGTDPALTWRDRHLGLAPVDEQPAEIATSISRLAAVIATGCDLDALASAASTAPALEKTPVALPSRVANVRIAVAGGPRNAFVYRDNLEALASAGAELVPFDPLRDEHLPTDIDGLVIGGGFPEAFAPRLAENRRLLAEVRTATRSGLVTWAECGGLLWLTRAFDGHELAGTVAADTVSDGRPTIGYQHATVLRANPVLAVGSTVRGHEFHSTRVEPGGDALRLSSRFDERLEGFASPTLLATYLHQHLGSDPTPAAHFVRACAATKR